MSEMMHKVMYGKTERYSFSKTKNVLDLPYLMELQINSYKRFMTEGIREILDEFSPIVHKATGGGQERFVLEFGDFHFDEPKYSARDCKCKYVTTYSAPLKVEVKLTLREKGDTVLSKEIYMGDFPLMTDTGSFIINGAERVVVSQLVRSPGVYLDKVLDKNGDPCFTTTVIPKNGAWLEFEHNADNVLYVHVDRKKKITATLLLRALGLVEDKDILDVFGNEEILLKTMAKDSEAVRDFTNAKTELYRNLRNGEVITVEGVNAHIPAIFYDKKRYDLSRVGRNKYNKKLSLAVRIADKTLAKDIVDPESGEVLAFKGDRLTLEQAKAVQNAGVNVAYVIAKNDNGTGDGEVVKIIGNNHVDLSAYVSCNPADLGILEMVHYPTLMEIWKGLETEEEKLQAVRDNVNILVRKQITFDDIISIVNYNIAIRHGIGSTDNIDHLSNRRIRAVGELLQIEVRKGFQNMERQILEKMNTNTSDNAEISKFINVKPVVGKVKEFFNTNQLSQFMDQQNPIAELTHKRRLSALGPGGLNRERAGVEVRDVHHSHYGRLCPIETPEGQNIGLVSSLATYARVNEYGFIETPYRKIDKATGIVTDEIEYMTADEEDNYIIAQSIEPLDENGRLKNPVVAARIREDIRNVPADKVDYLDVSPKQLVSVAASLIPFLENDDANRALMGSNMQRQAVPLLRPEAPIVATGIEHKIATDSGVMILAEFDGIVTHVSADYITVEGDNGESKTYQLHKFERSNHETCVNQRPMVEVGQRVKKGDGLADGPSTKNGELALGRNILIGFMTWEGYNYEDAILISEELSREDVFTSIHISIYETEARNTKLGDEEITRDIPNRGEDMLKDLDENGIIRIGAEVRSGDILVGKVAPKGETELSPEERLMRSIFGEKARDVRDVSLVVPHGEHGIVTDVQVFTKENKSDMNTNSKMLVRVYIAQKRKLGVGDKMAGRHGNKGVVSRVLPKMDMPFLPDGTSLQIVLNPLGVPSRMNIGQVLEVHLALACKKIGINIATPVFDGAKESEIRQLLEDNNLPTDGKLQLYDGRTGEAFENRTTVGYMYMLKLIHLVDDKIHARSTGSYSMITQQPLGGKAKFGGQRLGEMEVWAIEAYGAANVLQEMLTVKSDDVSGRERAYASITKGQNISEPGIPESFRVLVREMRSLCLNVYPVDENNQEIPDVVHDEAYGDEEPKDTKDIELDNFFADSEEPVAPAFDESSLFEDDEDGLFDQNMFDNFDDNN